MCVKLGGPPSPAMMLERTPYSRLSLRTVWLVVGFVPRPLQERHLGKDVARTRLVNDVVKEERGEGDHSAIAETCMLLAELRVQKVLRTPCQVIRLLKACEADPTQAKIGLFDCPIVGF